MREELFERIRNKYRSRAVEITPNRYTMQIEIGGRIFTIWLYQSSVGYWEGPNWIEEFCVDVSCYELGQVQSKYFKGYDADVLEMQLFKEISRALRYLLGD